MATRVHLADDHTMFREGLQAILAAREGVEVVGTSSTGSEAAERVSETKPDVIVTQLEMQPKSAEEIISGLREASPDSRIVVLTLWDNLRYVQAVSRMGIDTLMHKSSSAEELLATLGAVTSDPSGGNAVISMPRGLLERLGRGPHRRPLRAGDRGRRPRRPRALKPPHSPGAAHLGGDRQAPPGKYLREGGRALQERRREDRPGAAVDRHPRDHLPRRGRLPGRPGRLGSRRGLRRPYSPECVEYGF
jgi:ActR/RegA family two-component response regulator